MEKLGEHAGIEVFVTRSIGEAAHHWLTLQAARPHFPFQYLGWATSYLDSEIAAGRTCHALFVIGLKAGEPVVLFPLEIERHVALNRAVWLGQHLSDYGQPLTDPELPAMTAAQVLHFAIRSMGQTGTPIHSLALARMPSPSQAFSSDRHSFGFERSAEYASHALRFEGHWSEQYSKLRSSRSRQRLRSKWASLRRMGAISFGRVRNRAAAREAATRIIEWKSTQLTEAKKRNPFARSDGPMRNGALAAVSAGHVDVIALQLNGSIIAGSLVLRSPSALYMWICAFDPHFDSRFSIGTLLLLKSLEFASRAGFDRFDFLVGDEAYKNEWCNEHVALSHFFAGITWRGYLDVAALRTGLTIKHRLVASPRLRRTIELLRHELLAPIRLGMRQSDERPASPSSPISDNVNRKLEDDALVAR